MANAPLILFVLLLALAACGLALSPELLAQDSECSQSEGPECSLSALQKRALSRSAESIPGVDGLPGFPEEEEGEDDEAEEDSEDNQEEEDGAAEEQEQPKVEATTTPYTGPTMPPLDKNPPTPEPLTVKSINPIISRSNFLYDSVTGERFFAKGVAYNPRNEKYDHSFGSSVKVEGWKDTCVPGNPEGGLWTYTEDVIANEHEDTWSADLEAIANLGANTVRLYNVDPQKDHAKFMNKAASLGIYVIVPLNGKDWGFLPAFPSPDCYTKEIEGYGNVGVNALSFAKQLVKQFSQFPNTLLFTVANELAQNDKNGFAAFPCVKALTRDIHRYQASCGASMRRVPLIYSDVDMGPPDRGEIARYLTCALESEDDAVDAYGLNVYSWCDEAYPGDGKADNFKYSPYYQIKKDFEDLSVPMLFTEFGCNLGKFKTKCPYKGGRTWPDFKHMVGDDMGETVSGAVAFQFSMDKEEYGLTLSSNFLANQTKLYLLDNYFALQKVFKKYNVKSKWDSSAENVLSCKFKPSEVHSLDHKHHQPKCPSKSVWTKIQERHRTDSIGDWDVLPPTPDETLTALWHIHNQTECPAEAVAASVKKDNCCHMKC